MAEEKKEDLMIYADRKAREIAEQFCGPLHRTAQPHTWWTLYWQTMGGYGFFPFYR